MAEPQQTSFLAVAAFDVHDLEGDSVSAIWCCSCRLYWHLNKRFWCKRVKAVS